jgi:hypothetical protein
MALQQIGPDSLKGSVRTFEVTLSLAAPTASTYTFSNAVLNPFKILQVNYNNTVSSGTDDTTFDILKNGVTFTGDFHTLLTVTGAVTAASATTPNLAENSFATDDTFELEITTLGSNVDFLTVTVHAELL